jgi:hypothetical protein
MSKPTIWEGMPQGGAVARTTPKPTSGTSQGRPVSAPRIAAAPSPRSHISDPVRSALGGLTPSLSANVRRVARTE